MSCFFFFFNDTATTEIYTLSLHDALPIYYGSGSIATLPIRCSSSRTFPGFRRSAPITTSASTAFRCCSSRSEEHTSELQSLAYLVCRLLLEKKKNNQNHKYHQDNKP